MSYQFITNAKLPTRHGEFDIHIFENADGQEHVMLTVGLPVTNQTEVLNHQAVQFYWPYNPHTNLFEKILPSYRGQLKYELGCAL